MPTLKEIKGRIASVRSPLKITSAMKLVSSAKLRKAQNAIEAMRPYEEQLLGILASLQGGTAGVSSLNLAQNKDERKTIVAIASNSSLCGGFNANAIAKVRAIRRPGDTVYAIGRKMADAMRKEGFACRGAGVQPLCLYRPPGARGGGADAARDPQSGRG